MTSHTKASCINTLALRHNVVDCGFEAVFLGRGTIFGSRPLPRNVGGARSHVQCCARREQVGSHSLRRRKRSAFRMTETELNVMAALAQIGLINHPVNGYNTPAATGTPTAL